MIHYIYIYFKNNLTVPIVKDLLDKPAEKYRKIEKIISSDVDIENDLKQFMNGLKKKKNIGKEEINNDNKIENIEAYDNDNDNFETF